MSGADEHGAERAGQTSASAFAATADALGVHHPLTTADARIVSLVPSITELLFALGLGFRVVGRTGFCIHPREAVRAVPKVGGTKHVKLDVVRALRPTHVIVNIDENEVPTVTALRTLVPHVIVTHPIDPNDNFALFRLFSEIFAPTGADVDQAAAVLERDLRNELQVCAARTWPSETVLYLIWREPWMTVAADTYIARTLARVGWQVPHPEGGWSGAARYPTIAERDLATTIAGVDRVLLSSEPFTFRKTHATELRVRFPAANVQLIDGAMTSWYGSRAIAGLRYLRQLRAADCGDLNRTGGNPGPRRD